MVALRPSSMYLALWLCVSMGAVGYIYYYSLVPRALSVYADPYMSPALYTSIARVLETTTGSRMHVPDLYNQLNEHYPTVTHLSVAYRRDKHACVHVHQAKPVLYVKNSFTHSTHVLTQQGLLVDPACYQEWALADLPSIAVKSALNTGELDREIHELYGLLDTTLLEKYGVLWQSATWVLLQARWTDSLEILANHAVLQDRSRIAMAEQLYERKKGKEGRILRVDIRFKDFLVCTHL